MFKKQIFIALLVSCSSLMQADWFDAARPEDEREDYDRGTRRSGLLHQEVTTRSGRKRREFKPVESILGWGRSNNSDYNNEDNYDDEYQD
jgi:hypothetical protein